MVEGLNKGTSVSSSSLSKERSGGVSPRIRYPCGSESSTASTSDGGPVEVVAVRNAFLKAATRLNLVDSLGSHYPNLKVASRLDR